MRNQHRGKPPPPRLARGSGGGAPPPAAARPLPTPSPPHRGLAGISGAGATSSDADCSIDTLSPTHGSAALRRARSSPVRPGVAWSFDGIEEPSDQSADHHSPCSGAGKEADDRKHGSGPELP